MRRGRYILVVAITLLVGVANGQTIPTELDLARRVEPSLTGEIVRGGTELDQIRADLVLFELLSTPLAGRGPQFPYSVTVIESDHLNAYSGLADQLYVTDDMARLLGDDLGMWAAVLGHELAHSLYSHSYGHLLETAQKQRLDAYHRKRAAEGDGFSQGWVMGSALGQLAFTGKFTRDDEHAADQLGLLLIAEAGYHPDFALAMMRRLRSRLGEQSSFGAFFSDHPRWITRENRLNDAYALSLRAFTSRWGSTAASLGGPPPPIAELEVPVVRGNGADGTIHVTVGTRIRNAQGSFVVAIVRLYRKGIAISNAPAEFALSDGTFGLSRGSFVTGPTWKNEFVFDMPVSMLPYPLKKLRMDITLATAGEVLANIEQSRIR